MFSGIVAAVGRIIKSEKRSGGVRIAISASRLGLDDVSIGDSIAVNGVCLTVAGMTPTSFEADVSAETLSCTVGLEGQGEVNLEKSLRLADRLGGHLVSGHVDGVAEILAVTALGESVRLSVKAPADLARYIARKGSVAMQGVSLTVNAVDGPRFEVNIIPHTLSATTLRSLVPGAKVNLEVDQIARYVERMLSPSDSAGE